MCGRRWTAHELASTLFLWLSMLGTALTFQRGQHVLLCMLMELTGLAWTMIGFL